MKKYQDPLVWLVSKGADRLTENQMLCIALAMFAVGLVGAMVMN